MKSDLFWLMCDGDVSGPFLSTDDAKATLKDCDLQRGEVQILKTVEVARVEVTYTTTWAGL